MPLPLAVLIDAENIPATLFAPLQREATRLGSPIAWQLHGDFFTWQHPGWQAVAERENIEIRHQPQAGKNSADIAMTIAAMDLMREGVVRGICLVSSDSDFAPLALGSGRRTSRRMDSGKRRRARGFDGPARHSMCSRQMWFSRL